MNQSDKAQLAQILEWQQFDPEYIEVNCHDIVDFLLRLVESEHDHSQYTFDTTSEEIVRLRKELRRVTVSHNDECMFCALKDRIANQALKGGTV